MYVFAFLWVVDVAATRAGGLPAVIQTWTWGDYEPDFASDLLTSDVPLWARYPHLGFISLAAAGDRIQVAMVKRPPGDLYPADKKFCSRLLPAAVVSFAHGFDFPLAEIKVVAVHIAARPYVAACKCYMRLLIGMRMNAVGDAREIVDEDGIDSFCARNHEILEGHPTDNQAELPVVSDEFLLDLRTASFVTASFIR